MSVAAPSEPVYYYEVSAGNYRLVYFIPPEVLRSLHADDRIETAALEDFPDGVDLDCTPADFDDFEDTYGYRPKCDPEALGDTFFAMLSTPGYEKERRSGFLAAADLEGRVAAVEASLLDRELILPDGGLDARAKAAPRLPRVPAGTRAAQRARLRQALEEISVDGIDPEQGLGALQPTKISWSEGDPCEDAFVRLHRKQRGTG